MRNVHELAEIPQAIMPPRLVRRLPRNAQVKNIIGRTYKHSQVIGFAGFIKSLAAWLCKCKCGTLYVVRGNALRIRAPACGCLGGKWRGGIKNHPLYSVWCGVKQRCYNPSNHRYARYGGRGIKMCDSWRDSFQSFLDDMGPRPSDKHSIDRIDNDGNYEPANCRWALPVEQARNSSKPRMFSHNGEELPMSAWAERLGITREGMRQRIDKCVAHGVPVSVAISTPAGVKMPSFRKKSSAKH